MSDVLGLQEFIDWSDVVKLLSRFALDIVFASIVIRGIYYRHHKTQEYLFTYYLFNIITFSLCLLLRKVPAELGFALALFGVFGMLRYRTEQIRIRDLTYLFIVIGLGILNAVATRKVSVIELLFVNTAIVGATGLLELSPLRSRVTSTPMRYDCLQLLAPNREGELKEDIAKRTGLRVRSVQVLNVDLLRDAADIVVYHS